MSSKNLDNKTGRFIKQMLFEGGIGIGGILVLLGVMYFLSSLNDNYTQSNNELRGKAQAVEQEFNALQQQYNFIIQHNDLYQEVLKKQADSGFSISRQLMFEKFNQFRSQFDLNNLRLSVSSVQEMKGPEFKRKTSQVKFSDVNVDLDVLYDENVYELLNAMQHELSGVCVISRLNLALSRPLDTMVLKTIATTGTYPLVKASIKFSWYSINPIEADTTNDAAKK